MRGCRWTWAGSRSSAAGRSERSPSSGVRPRCWSAPGNRVSLGGCCAPCRGALPARARRGGGGVDSAERAGDAARGRHRTGALALDPGQGARAARRGQRGGAAFGRGSRVDPPERRSSLHRRLLGRPGRGPVAPRASRRGQALPCRPGTRPGCTRRGGDHPGSVFGPSSGVFWVDPAGAAVRPSRSERPPATATPGPRRSGPGSPEPR